MRFLKKIPDGYGRGRFYLRIKADGSTFCNMCLGKTKVRDMIRDAFREMDISNWKTLRPHALRSHFITILANDPSVSLAETMSAARHTSVSASANYQSINTVSESNKVQALLGPIRAVEEKSPVTCDIVKTEEELPDEIMEDSANQVPLDSVISESSSTREHSRFSVLTQFEMDNLDRDLDEIENVSSSPNFPRDPIGRFRMGTNDPSGHRRIHQRQSYPPSFRRQRQNSRRRNYQHPEHDYDQQYRNNYAIHNHASNRVLELRSIRRRLADMRYAESMHGFPYSSDREEHDNLYHQSQDHYDPDSIF